MEIGHTLPAPGTEKKELRKAFKQADGDKDGYLTADELRQAMDGMAGHGPLADDEFQVMLEECRRDAEIEDGRRRHEALARSPSEPEGPLGCVCRAPPQP